ncbi:MAG: hypothetical protein MUF75_02090 [Bacteroidia bacterium]|jgi:hypothetical protein|nr:hypothetical protein [Bacteroidia bacterium]
MKTRLFLIACIFSNCFFLAQTIKEKEVPTSVLQAFRKDFPDVKAKSWEKEGDAYEAEFKINKTESSAVYNASGVFLEKEIEIKASELPKFVLDYFEKNQPGKKIKEASKITAADGRITFEVEMEDTEYKFQEEVGLFEVEKEEEKKKREN